MDEAEEIAKEPEAQEEPEEQEEPTSLGGPVYRCVRCGRQVSYVDLERYVSFRCPFCGYRIFRKVRAPIVKRVKTR